MTDTSLSKRAVATSILVLALIIVAAVSIGGTWALTSGGGPAENKVVTKEELPTVKWASLIFDPSVKASDWNIANKDALDAMDNEYDWLTTSWTTSVKKADTKDIASTLIEQKDADIIYYNFEAMGLPLKELADEYPDTYFVLQMTGDFTTKKNFIRTQSRAYQAIFLSGMLAGALTETDKVGAVSGPLAPVNNRRVGFFALGAMTMNPDVKPVVISTGKWLDPAAEKEAAKTLAEDYNCDVLFNSTNSPASGKIAVDKGLWYIGRDMDYKKHGWIEPPDVIATSAVSNLEVSFSSIAKDYLAGDKHPKNMYSPGMGDSIQTEEGTVYGVDLSFNGQQGIPEGISQPALEAISTKELNQIKEYRTKMIESGWDPFMKKIVAGGQYGNYEKGTVITEAGEMPSLKTILGMDFMPEGVKVIS